MPQRKVHQPDPTTANETLCGVDSTNVPTSYDPDQITCGRCLKATKKQAWKEGRPVKPLKPHRPGPRKPAPEPESVTAPEPISAAVEEGKIVTVVAKPHDRKVWEPEPTIPLYEHDCEVCRFLGHFEDFDMYFCPQDGRPTVIVRDGNRPEHYISGLAFATQDQRLALAYARAHQKGLI